LGAKKVCGTATTVGHLYRLKSKRRTVFAQIVAATSTAAKIAITTTIILLPSAKNLTANGFQTEQLKTAALSLNF
jgi:hypothetical protein